MRIDRLTSKLQLALSDAQSLAVGLDHPAIEPAHLMQAPLERHGASRLRTTSHAQPGKATKLPGRYSSAGRPPWTEEGSGTRKSKIALIMRSLH